MYQSAVSILADIRAQFDLERQVNRHTDSSLLRSFNRLASDCRHQLFSLGSQVGLASLVCSSASATTDGTDYDGDRVDTFGVGGTPVYADRIRSVEWVPTSGEPSILPEITREQASILVGSSSTRGTPRAWYPVGPLSISSVYTYGVIVVPCLSATESFRIQYLPSLTPIATSPADVGIDTLSIPYEWILWEVGCRIGVRDADPKVIGYCESRRLEAKKEAVRDALTPTQSGDRIRSAGRARGVSWDEL